MEHLLATVALFLICLVVAGAAHRLRSLVCLKDAGGLCRRKPFALALRPSSVIH